MNIKLKTAKMTKNILLIFEGCASGYFGVDELIQMGNTGDVFTNKAFRVACTDTLSQKRIAVVDLIEEVLG